MRIKTILVVEDDDDTRNALAFLLETRGYAVLEAADGIDALQMLNESRPNAILTDLRMPRLNGWHFLAAKNANPRLRSIPVLVITAIPKEAPANVPVLRKPAAMRDILRKI